MRSVVVLNGPRNAEGAKSLVYVSTGVAVYWPLGRKVQAVEGPSSTGAREQETPVDVVAEVEFRLFSSLCKAAWRRASCVGTALLWARWTLVRSIRSRSESSCSISVSYLSLRTRSRAGF